MAFEILISLSLALLLASLKSFILLYVVIRLHIWSLELGITNYISKYGTKPISWIRNEIKARYWLILTITNTKDNVYCVRAVFLLFRNYLHFSSSFLLRIEKYQSFFCVELSDTKSSLRKADSPSAVLVSRRILLQFYTDCSMLDKKPLL